MNLNPFILIFCMAVASPQLFAAEPQILTDEAIRLRAPPGLNLTEQCLKGIKSIPFDFKFGWVSVPEDWDSPTTSKSISIFYYTNYREQNIPVLFINGGPGSHSHGLHSLLSDLANTRNLGMIYFDQRGTGCSSPIDYSQNPIDLMKLGRLYGTYEIAHDSEQIRQALIGNRKWKIVGQSFGGLVINRYITLFPTSLLSAHTYASSTDDSFTDFYLYRMEAQRSILNAHELEFKGSLQRIKQLKTRLTHKDCIDVNGRKICGPILADMIVYSLSGFPSSSKKYIDPLINEDGSANLENMKTEFLGIIEYFFTNKFYLTQSILRQETTSIGNLMVLSKDCKASYEKLFSQFNIQKASLVLSECNVISYAGHESGAYQIFEKEFPKIPVRNQLPRSDVYEALRKNPDLKYFVAASGMDPFASHYSMAEFAKGSPSIQFRLNPFFGHGGFRISHDFWDQIALTSKSGSN